MRLLIGCGARCAVLRVGTPEMLGPGARSREGCALENID